MTKAKTRGATRMRHLHISSELHSRLHTMARQWHWPTTSRYVEHELRRMLNMDTTAFGRKHPPAVFCVEEWQGRHCIFVRFQNNRYVFRYAQNTAQGALEVMGRLERDFATRTDPATDLGMNYWLCGYVKEFRFMQRTTQKDSWYIDEPGAVTP